MQHVNSDIRERDGFFSKNGFNITFTVPNIYQTDNLGDFLDNIDELKVNKLNITTRSSFKYTCIVYINNLYYKKIRDYNPDEIVPLVDELICLPKKKVIKDLIELTRDSHNNAELYAGDEFFPVNCVVPIPEDKLLKDVSMLYAPEFNLGKVIKYNSIIPKIEKKKYKEELEYLEPIFSF